MHNPSKDKVEEAAHDYESTGTMIAKSLRQQKLLLVIYKYFKKKWFEGI